MMLKNKCKKILTQFWNIIQTNLMLKNKCKKRLRKINFVYWKNIFKTDCACKIFLQTNVGIPISGLLEFLKAAARRGGLSNSDPLQNSIFYRFPFESIYYQWFTSYRLHPPSILPVENPQDYCPQSLLPSVWTLSPSLMSTRKVGSRKMGVIIVFHLNLFTINTLRTIRLSIPPYPSPLS